MFQIDGMWKNRRETFNTSDPRLLTGWKWPADKLRQRFSLPAARTLAVRRVGTFPSNTSGSTRTDSSLIWQPCWRMTSVADWWRNDAIDVLDFFFFLLYSPDFLSFHRGTRRVWLTSTSIFPSTAPTACTENYSKKLSTSTGALSALSANVILCPALTLKGTSKEEKWGSEGASMQTEF